MATIDRRKGKNGITYRARVRVRGHTVAASFRRKTDALDWARQIETDLKRGKLVPSSQALRRTFSDMVERYLDEVLPAKRHNKDQKNPTRHLNWWRRQLGRLPLVDITPDVISRRLRELVNGRTRRGGRTAATCNRYLTSLSAAFRVAANQWGWVGTNPLSKVSRLQEPGGRTRFLSDEERERLLTACKRSSNPHLYTIVVIALSTGARRSEISGLGWRNIQKDAIVLENTKNGERRVLPLTGHARELIRARQKVRRIDTDLLFPSVRDPIKPINFREAFETAVREAGISNVVFHDLRHTCASYLAMMGASPSEIAEVLGHKTLAMVKRYAHLSEAHTAGVVARMNERIFPGG